MHAHRTIYLLFTYYIDQNLELNAACTVLKHARSSLAGSNSIVCVAKQGVSKKKSSLKIRHDQQRTATYYVQATTFIHINVKGGCCIFCCFLVVGKTSLFLQCSIIYTKVLVCTSLVNLVPLLLRASASISNAKGSSRGE